LELQGKGSMQLFGSQIKSKRHWESLLQGPSLSPHFSPLVMLQPKHFLRIVEKQQSKGNISTKLTDLLTQLFTKNNFD
jgi:hypothetical protein